MEAKQAVENMLSDNDVLLEFDEKAAFDNYNRLLAHVFNSKGESVQLLLLEAGLARIAYLFDDYKYTSEYLAASERANLKRLNVHSIKGYVTNNGFNMSVIE